MKTLLEIQGFRFVEKGIIELNGMPDFRLQTKCDYSKRWNDVYLFDNQQQCLFAMEDIEYAKWLTGQYCYVKDDVEWFD